MKLNQQLQELIAVGASISANCQPCLDYHVRAARQAGAGEEEILEAIQVGRTVRRGAAAKMDSYFPAVVSGQPVEAGAEAEAGCGCGG